MKKLWICYVCLSLMGIIENVFSQHSMYSLQPAVDELHRQDYPMNAAALTQNANYPYEGTLAMPMDQNDWRAYENIGYNGGIRNNHRYRWNKEMGKYLPNGIEYESENEHNNRNMPWYFEPYGSYEMDSNENRLTEPSKRALMPLQKHENLFGLPSPSVDVGTSFRERQLLSKPINMPNYQMDLTDKFLRQIDNTDQQERRERYKENLQNLWHKYQQQEDNKIAENRIHQEKRLRVPPYYMLMQKKRSYPVLPWLPYAMNDGDSSKGFPLTKRSTQHTEQDNDEFVNINSNNDNIDGKSTEDMEDDFRELFGSMNIAKGKHVLDDEQTEDNFTVNASPAASSTIHINTNKDTSKKNLSLGEELSTAPSHKNKQHELNEIRNNEDEKNNRLGSVESKQSKRYLMKTDLTETPIRGFRRKKSIDWSQYFGIDRKRKSLEDNHNDLKHESKRKENNLDEVDLKNYRIDPIKVEKLKNKLRSIEDYIIRETIKYAGAHNGVKNSEEIEAIKGAVLSRLDTAYNLEKMRHILDEISSKSLEEKNHFKNNNNANNLPYMQNINNSSNLESLKLDKNFEKLLTKNFNSKRMEDSKEQMQKRNEINNYSDVSNYIDGLNGLDVPSLSSRRFDTNQCYIAEAILERCRAADALIMPGEESNRKFMYLCSAHQVCYLCGGSRLSCDYQYVDDSDNVCHPYNKKCQKAVQILLIILRDMPLLDVDAPECVINICQNIALQDTTF